MNLSILDEATDLADTTLAGYRSAIKKINKHIGETKLNDVKGMKKVIESITDNPNSQGNYFSVLMKILELEGKTELRSKYQKLLLLARKKVDKKPKKLTKPQKEIIKDYEKLKHDYVVSSKKKGIDKLSEIEFVLLFYVLLPPRRSDYYNMIYTKDESKTNNEEHNYLLEDDTGFHLIFNKFKRSKQKGQERFRIGSSRKERSLRVIIRKRKLKEGQFIYSKTRRQFTRDLGKVTTKVFGKKLLINDLRIIHNTKRFGKLKDNIEQDAKFQSHSVNTKINNYIRN